MEIINGFFFSEKKDGGIEAVNLSKLDFLQIKKEGSDVLLLGVQLFAPFDKNYDPAYQTYVLASFEVSEDLSEDEAIKLCRKSLRRSLTEQEKS